jgi:hypothetical protein
MELHAEPALFVAIDEDDIVTETPKVFEQKKLTASELYNELRSRGVEMETHESDLYVPMTSETMFLVIGMYEYPENVRSFRSEGGQMWYDIPFANMEFWEKKSQRIS